MDQKAENIEPKPPSKIRRPGAGEQIAQGMAKRVEDQKREDRNMH
jgi:hypothetical protein